MGEGLKNLAIPEQSQRHITKELRMKMMVSGQLYAPAALLQGKKLLVPIVYEAEWAPEPVWTRWRREKFPAPAGNLTLTN
jgi:hypothetical protein